MAQTPLRELIDKWVGGRENVNDYTREEFLGVLIKMKKKAESHLADAKKYGAPSEIRLQNYVIESILDPLIGKMEYGKRN